MQAEGRALAGDDTVFVEVRGGGESGWYGPVSQAVGRGAAALFPAAEGMPVTDHRGLHARLSAAAGELAEGMAGWAVGAVDCAVWDLHGQIAGRPVAELLAPVTVRGPVPAYLSWLRMDLRAPAAATVLASAAAEGWALTKWGLRHRDSDAAASAEAGRMIEAIGRAAEILGPRFAVDAVGTWNADLAGEIAGRLQQPLPLWLEDPLPEHNIEAYRRLSCSGLPLALGERMGLGADLPRLLDEARPAALIVDAVGCGGLTRACELVATTRQAGVPVYPHGRSMVPGIHLAAAFPDCVAAVEFRRQWEPRRQRTLAEPWLPEHGFLPAPLSAGLGARPRRDR